MSRIQSEFGSKISPVIIFIIVLLAVMFFIAALLHLLIRYLMKQRSAESQNYPQVSNSGAFQRQLQQLFHLHDSGLDQAYIDALPVFLYKDIMMGSKEPFDCAVCLCEFSEEDKLRLLPSCSHAFHIDCIDTWLLSNSTCPLCRRVILSFENPVFFFEDPKETAEAPCVLNLKPSEDENNNSAVISDQSVFSVRLGKFRSTRSNCAVQESEVCETSNSSLDARRCYSMGSFQYVVADLDLQVALCSSGRERDHCGGEVRTGKVRGGQVGTFTCDGNGGGGGGGDADGKKINSKTKGESFSVSKIWLWSKKGKFSGSTATHYSNAMNVSLP